jgi:hypothetical protein
MAGQPTPGPWEVQKLPHAAGELWLQISYRDPDGQRRGPVADIVDKQWIPAAELKYLATPEPEQWANARLIAASPDLLAACEALVETMLHEEPCHDPVCEWCPAVRQAQAAINKAKGL